MSSIDKVITTTLREVEEANSKTVFVVNTTKKDKRGQVIFSVPKVNGVGDDAVTIPATWIPIELTEQVSKNQLFASSDFRKAVSRGLISLVDHKWATDVLKSREATEELERLQNQQEYHRNIMTATKTDDIAIENPEGLHRQSVATADNNMVDDLGKINGISMSVIHTMEILRESKDQKGTIATLRAMGELEAKDYKYVLDECPKEFADVVDYARAKYNEVKE